MSMNLYPSYWWETALHHCLTPQKTLLDQARKALEEPLLSVCQKKGLTLPQATPNDYVSMAPYWWPDPQKPDGLPWIRRDGCVNPLFLQYDYTRLLHAIRTIIILIVSGHRMGNQTFTDRAAQQLKSWFITPETRMNPHLNFAQFVPGIADGRNFGIVDTIELIYLLDLVDWLPFNGEWTPEDYHQLQTWFAQFLNWLLNSDYGKQESNTRNNHGVWYDLQVIAYALFTQQKQLAYDQVMKVTMQRLTTQIANDGSLPQELCRAWSKHYTVGTMHGFALIATTVKHSLGLDLWNRPNANGVTLKRSMQWLDALVRDDRTPWPWQTASPLPPAPADTAPLYFLAGHLEDNQDYLNEASRQTSKPLDLLLTIRKPETLIQQTKGTIS